MTSGFTTIFAYIFSVVYIHDEALWNPPLGDYLGELKDETKGVPLRVFVSGGPKNYAYELVDGTQVCKVKGMTLNHRNSLILNLDSILRLVTTDEEEKYTVVNPHKIVRKDGQIFSKEEVKEYKIVYNKRRIVDGYKTLPFGWKEE